jgi:hypothetical protein
VGDPDLRARVLQAQRARTSAILSADKEMIEQA